MTTPEPRAGDYIRTADGHEGRVLWFRHDRGPRGLWEYENRGGGHGFVALGELEIAMRPLQVQDVLRLPHANHSCVVVEVDPCGVRLDYGKYEAKYTHGDLLRDTGLAHASGIPIDWEETERRGREALGENFVSRGGDEVLAGYKAALDAELTKYVLGATVAAESAIPETTRAPITIHGLAEAWSRIGEALRRAGHVAAKVEELARSFWEADEDVQAHVARVADYACSLDSEMDFEKLAATYDRAWELDALGLRTWWTEKATRAVESIAKNERRLRASYVASWLVPRDSR